MLIKTVTEVKESFTQVAVSTANSISVLAKILGFANANKSLVASFGGFWLVLTTALTLLSAR